MTNAQNKSSPRGPTFGPTFVARLTADEAPARRIANFMAESLDPAEVVCAAFERPDKSWQVDIHFRQEPVQAELREMIALAGDEQSASTVVVERIAPRDWVKESLAGLKPVTAGRFVVHGAHDRAHVPGHCIGIEIEAATAFGTGHHGTTRGCLLLLDQVLRSHMPRRVLDLGSGTGVLAIAAAKATRHRVLASDIDPQAAAVAHDNARLNGVGNLVDSICATGFASPAFGERAPFDLVLANILANPLRQMATPMVAHLAPSAMIILSGLLHHQAMGVIAAYRARGMVLLRHLKIDEWSSLLMQRAG